MDAISVKQPYAWLMATGLKRMQPITWKSELRGVLALHASTGFPESLKRLCTEHKDISGVMCGIKPEQLTRGAIIAVLFITDCVTVESLISGGMTPYMSHREYAFGNYRAGRHVLLIEAVRQLNEPVVTDGKKGIWQVPQASITPELARYAREMGERKW